MAGIRRWMEFEDWAEFYPRGAFSCLGDGRYETLVNFGGPGAAVWYHFWVRAEKGFGACVRKVTVAGAEFEPAFTAEPVSGTPPGMEWVRLGRVRSRRDYRAVTLEAPDGLAGFDRLLVLQVVDRLESGEIERRLAADGRGGEPLSGVPLGGVGAGKLELCADGRFRNITVNGNIDTPIYRSEASFFAVAATWAGQTRSRALTRDSVYGLPPVEELRYDGVYPGARLSASDRQLPVAVEIQASGTVIPRNVKDSALPLALFRVRVTATGETAVKATVAFCVENFLGRGGSVADLATRHTFDEGYYHLWEERAGNRETVWQGQAGAGIQYTGGEKEEPRSAGQYVLACDPPPVETLVGWRYGKDAHGWCGFADRAALPASRKRASAGEGTAGAVSVAVDLAPGETRELRFVFAWCVPRFWQGNTTDYGHYYTNCFGSAPEIADYGLAQFDRLQREAGELPALLLSSTLPAWLSRSLCNDAYTFSTTTWLTKDGQFAVNEGPTHMFGCMGTLDQKLYANHYYSLFFPELDRTELLGFARAQAADGGIQHDLGYGHLELRGKPHHWPDLTSSLVILSLKHYQLTGDQEYLDEVYPCLVKALLGFQLGRDTDGDGIANISGVGNTFDAEVFEGTSAYIASLWLAALRALEELAARRGDTAVAQQCRACREKARRNAIDELWNGEFFVNYYDTARKVRCANSHVSQVAGEFFARLCGFGSLYGDGYVHQALTSMFRLNAHPGLRFPTNEATPAGKMPYRKLWGWLPHSRVYFSGTGFYFDLRDEALAMLKRLEDVVVANGDNRWDQRLFYEPDTGRQHWGRFYMTAPATWYVYQALLGYFWDKPAGVFGLTPNLPCQLLPFAGPVFVPGFWGWLQVDAGGARMSLRVMKRCESGLRITRLRLPARERPLRLTADNQVIPCCPQEGGIAGVESWWSCDLDLARVDEIVFAW